MSIAKHYETGETLPEEVYKKLLAARTFRAGSFSLRQVSIRQLAANVLYSGVGSNDGFLF